MKTLKMVGVSILFALLTWNSGFAQQDQASEPRQEEPKPAQAKPQERKPAPAPNPKPEQTMPSQKPKAPKPEQGPETNSPQTETQKRSQEEANKAQEQTKKAQEEQASKTREEQTKKAQERQMKHGHPGQPNNATAANKGQRIPEPQFRERFGREHTFVINRPVIIENRRRFQFASYWFEIVDPWPTDWVYTDECYIDYIDDTYYLLDPLHPGVRLVVIVVG